MSIKISKPSDADAKSFPREYAIYTQIPGSVSGSVSSEVCSASVISNTYDRSCGICDVIAACPDEYYSIAWIEPAFRQAVLPFCISIYILH